MRMNQVSNEDVNLMIDILCSDTPVDRQERYDLEERLREVNVGENPYEGFKESVNE